MLNHETGQMDWDRYPIGGSPPSPSSYYINPQNMYDMSTPYGRELMDEAYPSNSAVVEGHGNSKWTAMAIIAAILIVFFFPFH